MSRFRLVRHLLATASGGGGGGGGSITYDTRFGTTTDTNGWITFTPHSGAQIYWLNYATGNDSNNGSSDALAFGSWDHAFSVAKTNYAAGTQFIIRIAAGGTYTDSGANTLQNMSGISLAYPLLVQSYDPTDPTNSAKYGRPLSSGMPSIHVTSTGTNSWSNQFGNTDSYFFVQGVEFDGLDVDTQNFAHISFSGSHEGVGFQNCRFKQIEPVLGLTSSVLYTHISKSVFYGQWAASGNAAGINIGDTQGLYFQDNILVHTGWRIGANRFDTSANGSPNVFGHGNYYEAGASNGHFDRIVYISSAADGFNLRGQGAGTQIVTIDEPIAANIGGFSNNYTERPGGVLNTVDDWLVMGGTDLTYGSPRSGISFKNTLSGSYINNVVVADQPNTGVDFGLNANAYIRSDNTNGLGGVLPIDIYLQVTNLRGYNWAATGGSVETFTSGGDPTKVHLTINNSILDLDASSYGTGNSIATGTTYPSALDRAGLFGALGFTADKATGLAQLCNYMICRPDLPWAQWIIGKGLPAYGLTPLYATVASIDLTGITPTVVFGTSVSALTLSSANFTHGTAKTVNIIGVPTGWGVWSVTPPSGFTINSVNRTLTYDGSGSARTPGITLNAGLMTIEAARSDTITLTIS